MISENCSLEEFVEMVKGKEPWEVIMLAVEEATDAERKVFRSKQAFGDDSSCGEMYSRRLKRLINLLRYEVKFKRRNDEVYRLYAVNWGTA